MAKNVDYTKWLKEFDKVMKEKDQPKELLGFYREMLAIQGDLFERDKALPALDAGATAKVKEKLDNGEPVISTVPFPVNAGLFTEGFQRIGKHFKESTDREAEAEQILNEKWDFPAMAKELEEGQFEDLMNRAEEKKLDTNLFAFIVTETLKPFYQAYAQAYGGLVTQEKWHQKYCPVCGEKPFIATLEGEGQRVLACDLCGFEWEFARLVCPYCGAGHESFQELEVEDDASHRIHACSRCKGYLKVVDRRKEKEDQTYNLPLEDLLTLHLDIWARKQGYTREPVEAEQ